jgi:hypothetical protein
VQLPSGDAIAQWFTRAGWLRERTDAGLLEATLRAAADLVLQTSSVLDPDGWQPARRTVRQSHGMRWELEVDDAVAGLIAGCAEPAPVWLVLQLLAAATGTPAEAVGQALLPVLRDLIQRGFLLPVPDGRARPTRDDPLAVG